MTTYANNLVELQAQLIELTRGKTAEDAFNTLQDLVGEDIRVRCEIVDSNGEDKTSDGKRGRFAHLNDLKVARVLLTSNRLKSDFGRQLVRECNGVVLEYPSWNVLSVPAMMFNPRFRITDVINNMDSYSIYEIKDGTTVTLYYYNSKWCLSSTNGFDVSDYQWMGASTYIQALQSVAKLYPDFSFDKLDTKYAYTVGFRHSEFHPLLSDPAKLWLIQACNLTELNTNSVMVPENVNIGIPAQTATVVPGTKGRALFKHMQDRNTNAMGRYLNSIRDVSSVPDIHYGYVLRSNSLTGATCANSNIILESDLLKQIRFLMYNLPKRKFSEAVPVTAANRLEYTILRAYLSCSTKYVFLNLFPQFGEQYRKYDILFTKLSNRIIAALRNRNTRESITATKTPKDAMNARIDKLAFALVKHIEDCSRINAMDAQGPNIVLDFIMDRKHLDLYYTCLFA